MVTQNFDAMIARYEELRAISDLVCRQVLFDLRKAGADPFAALFIVCCADPFGAVDAELSAIEAQLPDDYLYPGDIPYLCKE